KSKRHWRTGPSRYCSFPIRNRSARAHRAARPLFLVPAISRNIPLAFAFTDRYRLFPLSTTAPRITSRMTPACGWRGGHVDESPGAVALHQHRMRVSGGRRNRWRSRRTEPPLRVRRNHAQEVRVAGFYLSRLSALRPAPDPAERFASRTLARLILTREITHV